MMGALLAGWDFVEGIEREPRPDVPDAPDYLAILKARVSLAEAKPHLFEPKAKRKKSTGAKAKSKRKDPLTFKSKAKRKAETTPASQIELFKKVVT